MCGFVGMVGPNEVAPEIHIALQTIQHRGQDSAGIATMGGGGGEFFVRRGLGSVAQAIKPGAMENLPGNIGIGHVRYPTIGQGVLADAQPFFYRQPGVLMAHNGNVTNYAELRESLLKRSIHLLSRCDIEPALCEFADALMQRRQSHHTIEDAMEAVREVRARVRGSYSIVAALMLDDQPTLVVFRDPHGIRPCVLGRRGDGTWIACSESVALDALGMELVEAPDPGQVLFLRPGEAPIRRDITASPAAPCIFEFIYFARPDSVIEGRSVYEARLSFGRALADRVRSKGIQPEVVMPVPDTARPAATTLAEGLEVPLREGFIKNRYSGRTFIMPDALTRVAALRLKLNTLPSEIRGRKILLVDDSIVRGTTLRRVIALAREAGAAEVHLAIHSPPVRHPCYYGIDMSTESELFARQFDEDVELLERQAAQVLGADSLTYLPMEMVEAVFPGPHCAACFTGSYPQPLRGMDIDAISADRSTSRGFIEHTQT